MKKLDLTGKTFGKLKIIHIDKNVKFKRLYWICECECGSIKSIRGSHLKSGSIVSCGCYQNEHRHFNNYKHGKCFTKLYRVYKTMINRCYDNNVSNYNNYGGRGIKVCSEWQNSFQVFYKWATTNGYKEGLTIDRINNDKGYSPDNCKWATSKEQANNRRGNRIIEFNGERKTLAELAKEYSVSSSTLSARIKKHGKTVALTGRFSGIGKHYKVCDVSGKEIYSNSQYDETYEYNKH